MLLLAAQMVIHLALQFFVDGLSQLADVAVRLPTHSGKPGGAVQPQREEIQNFLRKRVNRNGNPPFLFTTTLTGFPHNI